MLELGINGLMMSFLDMCQLLELPLELFQLLLELKQFLLKLLLVFLTKFPFLENYMYSAWFLYNIILVSNKLIG